MRIGQRVHLRHAPASWGTVSKVNGDRFQVAWHTPERKRGQPRLRFWYGPSALPNVLTRNISA